MVNINLTKQQKILVVSVGIVGIAFILSYLGWLGPISTAPISGTITP